MTYEFGCENHYSWLFVLQNTCPLSVPQALALFVLCRLGTIGILTRRVKVKDKHASYVAYGVSAATT